MILIPLYLIILTILINHDGYVYFNFDHFDFTQFENYESNLDYDEIDADHFDFDHIDFAKFDNY